MLIIVIESDNKDQRFATLKRYIENRELEKVPHEANLRGILKLTSESRIRLNGRPPARQVSEESKQANAALTLRIGH